MINYVTIKKEKHMNLSRTVLALLLSSSILIPAHAQDSATRASAASVEASMLAGASVAWVAYAGSEFTVTAIKSSGRGVELSLKGASQGIETSATIARQSAQAASTAVGTSVIVVAETTGYALMAAGRLIAFVPNEAARALLQRSGR
jgi:hypothetical protein